MSNRNVLLPDAVHWLTVWPNARILTIDGRSRFASHLHEEEHEVFTLTPDPGAAARLDSLAGVTAVCGHPEAMPIEPCQFDVVVSHERFHTVDAPVALSEIARVLRPGGCFSASYIIRDDSVPWVRRLAALLRRYDPMAMRGDYGQASFRALDDSKYFPEVERRAFRIWRPVSLDDLQALVRNQPLSKRLSDHQRDTLARDVAGLFSSAVRPGDKLRLPFQFLCVRAWVSHDELTADVTPPDGGVQIII